MAINPPPPTPPIKFNIPLVHKICEFYSLFHNYLKLFPKTEKYSLGIRIENLILDVTEFLLTASYSPRDEKIDFLIKADAKINFLKLLVRMANETKIIDNKKYLILQEKLQEIGRMLGGWIKSIKDR